MKEPIRPAIADWIAALPPGPDAITDCIVESRLQMRPCGITEAEFRNLTRSKVLLGPKAAM